jgi:hypothetical protein
MKKLLVTTALLCLASPNAFAEDINTIFKKVGELAAQENYPKAMEELSWANKELQKLHFAKLESMLPAEVAGFKGEKAEAQSAMGMTTIQKTYKNGNEKIELNITGSALGGTGGAAGGLAALGRMGAMMANQPGVDTFRVDGRTATLKNQRNRAELTLFMESGGMLQLKQNNAKDEGAALKKVLEGLGVAKLDSYLKGAM